MKARILVLTYLRFQKLFGESERNRKGERETDRDRDGERDGER